jgi:hypothetical protein
MKFLASQMAGLKVQLLDRIVHTMDPPPAADPLSRQRMKPDKMSICKAVEDRICKRIDLASRTDLSDQEVMGALRLLLKIVRQSDLPVDFSAAEIYLLTRGIRESSREAATTRF